MVVDHEVATSMKTKTISSQKTWSLPRTSSKVSRRESFDSCSQTKRQTEGSVNSPGLEITLIRSSQLLGRKTSSNQISQPAREIWNNKRKLSRHHRHKMRCPTMIGKASLVSNSVSLLKLRPSHLLLNRWSLTSQNVMQKKRHRTQAWSGTHALNLS